MAKYVHLFAENDIYEDRGNTASCNSHINICEKDAEWQNIFKDLRKIIEMRIEMNIISCNFHINARDKGAEW